MLSTSGAADLFTYSYIGNPYNIFFNPISFAGTSPFAGQYVTGSILIDDPRNAPFTNGEYLTGVRSFSITDGTTSYTGPSEILHHQGSVTLNSSFEIITWTIFASTNKYPAVPSSAVQTDGDLHIPRGDDAGAMFSVDGTFVANSLTPGTWSAPIVLSLPFVPPETLFTPDEKFYAHQLATSTGIAGNALAFENFLYSVAKGENLVAVASF